MSANLQTTLTTLTSPRIAAVLGSGGHTAEMFRMIKHLEEQLRPRIFFCSADDKLAERMVSQFEEYCLRGQECRIVRIPRPRRVGQSYFTSIFTTLWSILYCIWRLHKMDDLDLVLCNGPAIAVCIAVCVYATSLTRWRRRARIVYVESFARTRALSLTGRILGHLVDEFFVQWPQLDTPRWLWGASPRYAGLLV